MRDRAAFGPLRLCGESSWVPEDSRWTWGPSLIFRSPGSGHPCVRLFRGFARRTLGSADRGSIAPPEAIPRWTWGRSLKSRFACASRPRRYPPLAPARRGHVFRPAVVDGRLEVLAEQGRHPALAADAAAAALPELGL